MENKVGIIGYGSMGKMILSNFAQSDIMDESDLFISNRTYEKIKDLNEIYPGVNICKNNIDLAKKADVIFVCAKPIDIMTILKEIIDHVKESCHIVSLNGSILLSQLEKICVTKKLSKVIPSITAEVQQSVTLVCHNTFTEEDDKYYLKNILECFGAVMEIPENELGMGSELTSCMPGFIGSIFKIITEEAQKHTSINKNDILKMIIETMYGTGKLLVNQEMSFDDLVARVSTKGGITEEGTKILEEKLPQTINEMFEKTLGKRKITMEKIQELYL